MSRPGAHLVFSLFPTDDASFVGGFAALPARPDVLDRLEGLLAWIDELRRHQRPDLLSCRLAAQDLTIRFLPRHGDEDPFPEAVAIRNAVAYVRAAGGGGDRGRPGNVGIDDSGLSRLIGSRIVEGLDTPDRLDTLDLEVAPGSLIWHGEELTFGRRQAHGFRSWTIGRADLALGRLWAAPASEMGAAFRDLATTEPYLALQILDQGFRIPGRGGNHHRTVVEHLTPDDLLGLLTHEDERIREQALHQCETVGRPAGPDRGPGGRSR